MNIKLIKSVKITFKKKILALLFPTCLIFSNALPQSQSYSTENKKAIKLYQEAEYLLKQRQFDPAIENLYKALEKDTAFVEAHLRLASIYKTFLKPEKSRYHYVKAAEIKPNDKEMSPIYGVIGDLYFNEGNYDGAKKYLEKVVEFNSAPTKVVDQAKRNLERVNFALKAKENPVEFKPKLMDKKFNRFYMQAYPVLTADLQYFIFSMRPGNNKEDDEDILISKKENGVWSDPKPISQNINTPFNEGTSAISGDGKTLVFTSCNKEDGLGACDIYISYKVGNDWTVPGNLGAKVNSQYWESEPTLSADGKTIFFTSDRKGGLGKEDIYFTTLNEKGEWSQAKNAGRPINTEDREVSPFLHSNGKTLFFSSTGHIGMGGFDIFYSNLKDSTWEKPTNLGYPINNHINNNSIFISSDNKKGFYSVDESDGIKYTRAFLYEFDVPQNLQEVLSLSSYAQGTVYDSETKKKLEAKIDLIDLKTQKVVQRTKSDDLNGDYLVVLTEGSEYALYVTRPGYLFKSVFFDYKNKDKFNPLTLDVYLDPIKAGSSVILNNIFFPSNSYQLDPKSKTELDKIGLFLKANPTIKIEFGGHTDNVGSDSDNMNLSENRAKAVYDYFIKEGLSTSRLKFKGYGETKPITPNDSEENRQKNRRIEFKIL